MITHAVSGLPFGFLTISPAEYSAPVDGDFVTLVICGVVFPVPELSVQAVIKTHPMMRKNIEIIEAVLFIILNREGEYFKKSFYSLNSIEL
jgi:hypothetical protein